MYSLMNKRISWIWCMV